MTANEAKAAANLGFGAPRLRTFYILLAAEIVSMVGSLVSYLAVSIAVFRQTGHATPLALVEFFAALLVIVAGGFAGALVDRFDRRSILLVANVGFVICSGVLLLAFASGAFRLWHLYALSLASAMFAALQRPAFQASVAMLTPDEGRDRANALGQLTGPLARMVAPAVAGVVFAAIGVIGAIALDVASFLIVIVVLLIVRIPRPAETQEGRAFAASVWGQAFDGLRYLAARPALLALAGYNALMTFLTFGALVLGTPYVLARTGSETTFGLVLSVLNVGAIAGALAMSARTGGWPRVRTVFVGFASAGLLLALTGVARGPIALAAALFGFAFLIPIVNAASASIFQATVAPDLQGRVFAAIGQVGGLLTPVAFLAAGPLADHVFEPARQAPGWRWVAWAVGEGHGAGIGLLFVIAGALTTFVSLVVYSSPVIRRLETPGHKG